MIMMQAASVKWIDESTENFQKVAVWLFLVELNFKKMQDSLFCNKFKENDSVESFFRDVNGRKAGNP